MTVQYPSHLYIRIDRPLRAALLLAADGAGQNVSAFARGILQRGLDQDRIEERPAALRVQGSLR